MWRSRVIIESLHWSSVSRRSSGWELRMNLDRRWLGVALWLGAALLSGMLGFAESTSAELLLLIAAGAGDRPPDALLRTIDSTDGSTLPGATVPAYTGSGR